jgi:hypothetical protein
LELYFEESVVLLEATSTGGVWFREGTTRQLVRGVNKTLSLPDLETSFKLWTNESHTIATAAFEAQKETWPE